MKLIHLSDLHIGKRVNEFSMLEDQRYILAQMVEIVERERADAVIIAGDLYDRPDPPAEAVELFDDFLARLAQDGRQVLLISGNHDSQSRIAFGARLLRHGGVYVSPVYRGEVCPVELEDAWGPVRFYLLPFLKPAQVRAYCLNQTVESYTDAQRCLIDAMELDEGVRNVLVTHQFVAGGQRCESEMPEVGGAEGVDVSVYDGFDYVALGHLHGAQHVGRATVRYCGTPLKYSFSEAGHEKSVTVVELREKGDVEIRSVPLKPLRELRELRGRYEELMQKRFYENTTYPEDYLHMILTDEEDIPDAIGRLRSVYPYIMRVSYDNCRTRSGCVLPETEAVERLSPLELFAAFYEGQNGRELGDEQRAFVQELISQIWEEHI